ncbi:hypothetical protein AFLA_002294 [Aspergillus flavus NRRL3357]|nr:hypothetical protein AFLA_002294 [Aspergillus flavus NRRL3357]
MTNFRDVRRGGRSTAVESGVYNTVLMLNLHTIFLLDNRDIVGLTARESISCTWRSEAIPWCQISTGGGTSKLKMPTILRKKMKKWIIFDRFLQIQYNAGHLISLGQTVEHHQSPD